MQPCGVIGEKLFFRGHVIITMRAWPVARSIFDAPLCERSERGDNKLDNSLRSYVREANERTTNWINVISARQIGARTLIAR